MKKCVYCKSQLDNEAVVDVCYRCGVGVWGEKMFKTIVSNMEGARDVGDLYQGSVTKNETPEKAEKPKAVKSIVSDAVASMREVEEVEKKVAPDTQNISAESLF